MRPALLAAIAAIVTVPSIARAQQWSPAQQEVWDVEETCWAATSLDELMPCFHEDFRGWGLGDDVPTDKVDRRATFARVFETEDVVSRTLEPLAITMRGNMAITLYVATYTSRDRKSGARTTSVERWMDVLVKEEGRWTWIADHGVKID